jgi:predicted MFS family arabinose efflux permease
LSTPASGYFIEVFRGCANTIEILCLYELAAALCTASNAVSIMAFVLAARNLANEMGTIVGGNLFTHVFHNHYVPLVLVGLITPLLSFALVPYAVHREVRE